MSDEIPERSEIVRSTIITVILTVVLLSVGLALWAWSSPEVIETELSPIDVLNDINPFLAPIIEILVMSGMFLFLTITVVNIRLYLTQIRAGWTELILLLIVVFVMTFLMFESGVAIVTLLLSLAIVVYLYMLQE
ncbi:MAG: hypothetical protein ACFFBM_01580 [Promethearchaeota archaeon]